MKQKQTVLIVEDEFITALAVEDYLKRLGFKDFVHVSNGEQGVKLCPSADPDVVILDIRLAGEMDGFDTAKKIRELCDDVPIIFLTAITTEETEQKINDEFENAYYLPKPIEMPDLEKMLKVIFEAEN
ncbi:MAG: response regulator [Calditrichaeota bacterium]|nr:response regulator [Calditrichota bacterium]